MIFTFDLYGTLVDWNYSISNFLRLFSIAPEEFFKLEYEQIRSYKPYSEILKLCLKNLMKDYDEEIGNSFVLCFAKSPPFPDTVVALKKLKLKGYKLGIISNTERRLIKITLSGIEDLFDWVITAEDTGYYKPNIKAFEEAYKLMKVDLRNVVHVSAYPQYDLVSAKNLVKTILVDRYNYEWETKVKNLLDLLNFC